MGKQILRKCLSKKIEGNRETVVNEYYEIDGLVTEEEINTLYDIHGDDPETAFVNGLSVGFDDEIFAIDVDALLEWMNGYLAETEEEERGQEYETIRRLREKLVKYRPYDISL